MSRVRGCQRPASEPKNAVAAAWKKKGKKGEKTEIERGQGYRAKEVKHSRAEMKGQFFKENVGLKQTDLVNQLEKCRGKTQKRSREKF